MNVKLVLGSLTAIVVTFLVVVLFGLHGIQEYTFKSFLVDSYQGLFVLGTGLVALLVYVAQENASTKRDEDIKQQKIETIAKLLHEDLKEVDSIIREQKDKYNAVDQAASLGTASLMSSDTRPIFKSSVWKENRHLLIDKMTSDEFEALSVKVKAAEMLDHLRNQVVRIYEAQLLEMGQSRVRIAHDYYKSHLDNSDIALPLNKDEITKCINHSGQLSVLSDTGINLYRPDALNKGTKAAMDQFGSYGDSDCARKLREIAGLD